MAWNGPYRNHWQVVSQHPLGCNLHSTRQRKRSACSAVRNAEMWRAHWQANARTRIGWLAIPMWAWWGTALPRWRSMWRKRVFRRKRTGHGSTRRENLGERRATYQIIRFACSFGWSLASSWHLDKESVQTLSGETATTRRDGMICSSNGPGSARRSRAMTHKAGTHLSHGNTLLQHENLINNNQLVARVP
jgi:hypothetical protein